jgi:hypothetical protein
MIARELPEELKGQSSRETKEWHKEMMAKFKKLNAEYNKRAEGEFSKDIAVNNEDILNFNEENVFTMINKAKNDIKTINSNNDELNKKIREYVDFEKDCNTIIETLKIISETYYKLSTKSQLYDIENKLEIKQSLIDFDVIENIKNFENDIKVKINDIKEQIKNNKKKISDFKKLVLDCMSESEDGTSNEKNICSVCVTRKINTCLNPCGHTFCLICVDKMNNKCGMCRATFISKIKMYIADEDALEDESNNNNNNNNNEDEVVGFDGFDYQPFVSIPIPNVISSVLY